MPEQPRPHESASFEPGRLAALLDAAHHARELLDAGAYPIASLSDAYAVQDALTARRVAGGRRIAGWKLGYTSAAMREQMGIDEPNFGPLFDDMFLPSWADVSGRVTQPRVEPEIAIRFDTDVPGDADRAAVLAAAGTVYACLEVVDSVWAAYRFTLAHNTADGSSAALVVLGPELAGGRSLDEVAVELFRNGESLARATGAAASGHPADGVVWLAGQLARQGRVIRAGEVVITGGLTAAPALEPGDVIAAVFDESVRVEVVADAAGRGRRD